MANKNIPWTPGDPEAFAADYARGATNPDLAALHGTTMGRVLKYLVRCRRQGTLPPRQTLKTLNRNKIPLNLITAIKSDETEERQVREDGSVNIELNTSRPVRTLQELIEVCEIATETYEITSWGVKKWDMGIKAQHTDEDGNVTHSLETKQMFAVSVKLKPRVVINALRDEIKLMLEEAKTYAPQHWPIYTHKTDIDHKYMLEISISDHHFGKLAWWEECGESYDLKIAQSMFKDAVEDLLNKASAYSFDEILFIVGNDLFNSDNRNNTTTAGTPQTTDARYQKTFTTVRKVIQDVIERLLRPRAKKVRVIMVSGNHDTETVFMFGEVLDAWFHNCEDVEIDNSPTQRKYVEYGECMLLFTHGNEEKHNELPLIMAQEKREMWGRTRFREIHLGHFHKRKVTNFIGVDEFKGVCVRILPSLCAAEDWHTSRGYVANIRSAEAFVWERNSGLCAQFIHNAKPFVKANPPSYGPD